MTCWARTGGSVGPNTKSGSRECKPTMGRFMGWFDHKPYFLHSKQAISHVGREREKEGGGGGGGIDYLFLIFG
jgi:hypothetical protein